MYWWARSLVPSCKGSFHELSSHAVSDKVWPHHPEVTAKYITVSLRGLIMNSAWSSSTPYKALKSKLVSSYTLSRWQRVNKLICHPAHGWPASYSSHGCHVGTPTEDEAPGCLFLGLFLERLPIDIRITWWIRSSRTPARWRCMPISYGMLVELKQQILFLLLLLPHLYIYIKPKKLSLMSHPLCITLYLSLVVRLGSGHQV